MKNLSAILAVACALLMVACGGEPKSKKEPIVPVASKAKELADRWIACDGDTLKQKDVKAEIDSCRKELLLPDQERFDKMIIEYINNDRRNKRRARLGITQEEEIRQDTTTIQLVYQDEMEE